MPDRAGGQALSTVSVWDRAALACAGVAAIAFVIVFSHISVGILTHAGHDDNLFIQLGRSLSKGEWLGPFNVRTLAKGPGYPLFLAVNSWLGLPVSVAHALFHCAATALFGWVVAKVAGSRWLGLAVFCLVLWHPLFLTQRIIREGIYTGQIVMVYALAAYSLLVAATRWRRIQGGAATGLVLGWCWLTREEGALLLPGIAVLILVVFFSHARGSSRGRTIAVTIAAAAVAFLATQAAFQLLNRVVYGSFVGVDFKEANFQSAVNGLQSVRAGELIVFVPVSRSTREEIYRVSPSFATLKDYLDPPGGSFWEENGCKIWKWTCGEIAGGWFLWALRDAAAAHGHYQSPAKASGFFRQVASEINVACESGKLRCEQSLISYLPRVTREQLSWIPERFGEAIRFVSLLHAPTLGAPPSTGNREELTRAAAFLNYPLHTESLDYPPRHVLNGWYFGGTDAWLALDVKTPDGRAAPALIERDVSPDLERHFGTRVAKRQRFTIDTTCRPECRLNFSSDKNDRLDISIDEVVRRSPGGFALGGATLYFDVARNTESSIEPNDVRIIMSHKVGAAASRLYAALIPGFLALGGLVFIGAAIWIARLPKFGPPSAVMGIAASLWVLIAARIVILVLIDVTSFPAIHGLYLGPAMYLAPAAALLSLWAVVTAIRERRAPQVSGAS